MLVQKFVEVEGLSLFSESKIMFFFSKSNTCNLENVLVVSSKYKKILFFNLKTSF